MEDRKTVYDYAGQVFTIFGVMMFILNFLCYIFGEEANGTSSLFDYGREAMGLGTMLEFFLVAVISVILRILFFTNLLFKRLGATGRTIGMLLAFIGSLIVCIIQFDWFPITMWVPWALFFLFFVISFGVSMAIMSLKTRAENKKMEEALQRLKNQSIGYKCKKI